MAKLKCINVHLKSQNPVMKVYVQLNKNLRICNL